MEKYDILIGEGFTEEEIREGINKLYKSDEDIIKDTPLKHFVNNMLDDENIGELIIQLNYDILRK